MKILSEEIKLLGLSNKELRVLNALRAGKSTPLTMSVYARVRRPTVYQILPRLNKRGLIKSNIQNGKKYWSQAKDGDLNKKLYETKKVLLNFEEGKEEIFGLFDSTVVVYRGAITIRKLMKDIFKNHKNQKIYGIQSDTTTSGWNKIFGVEGTNEINRSIKKNGIIVECILPSGWFERQAKLFDKKWAKDFVGRSAVTHEIDEEYFQNAGQIFIFKNSLYLIAMKEEIIIEIKNSEIQKLILSMFHFIQDNSRKIDVNAILRELIKEEINEVS